MSMNTYNNSNSVIKDNNIKEKFNLLYHNVDTNIIKQNILMANEIIPEMLIPSNLIYLKGKLNGNPLKIMVDTGASSNVIFKSVIDKCDINYLVDDSTSFLIQSAHEIKPTVGTLWYLELEFELEKNKSISVPITATIIDDIGNIQTKSIEKQNNNLINSEFNNCESHEFDIILGMSFLKSYKANIDFNSMTITLNNNIIIKFK